MKIETLIVTMNQHDFSLMEKMNVQTDGVIGNQTDYIDEQSIMYEGNKITYYSSTERGVGKNRNLVLEKSTAEICVFADDDMKFVDNYPQIVEQIFEEVNNADIMIFNLIEKHPRRYINKKINQINRFNYAKYGAARLAIRRQSIIDAGIKFSLKFGGGAEYSAGEDTLFLRDCLKKRLKIVAVPYAIAEIDQTAESTWFCGYNEKFFYDKGALYCALSPIWASIYCVRFILKYKNCFRKEMPCFKALRCMLRGIRGYRNDKSFQEI